MGVVIELCIKYSGGPTRMRVADVLYCTKVLQHTAQPRELPKMLSGGNYR
jgi:hypothetical protein